MFIIDKVRATEARGKEAALTGSRWCLLKHPEKLTDKQVVKLEALLAINLKTVRAYLLNWFRCRARIALGAGEGFNNKSK